MAGRGPRPKDNPRRTNKHPSVELTGSPVDQAPELYQEDRYSEATRRWWRTWASAPQSEAFMPTDWERLQQLAPLVEQYWQEPKPAILAEIRLNEERLGATIRDRQSLRMSVGPKKPPDPSELPPEVADIQKYRDAYKRGDDDSVA